MVYTDISEKDYWSFHLLQNFKGDKKLNITSDVIIIGAGFSGLAARLKLKKLGISSIILEARDRVGGLTKTDFLQDGTQIDLGDNGLDLHKIECRS